MIDAAHHSPTMTAYPMPQSWFQMMTSPRRPRRSVRCETDTLCCKSPPLTKEEDNSALSLASSTASPNASSSSLSSSLTSPLAPLVRRKCGKKVRFAASEFVFKPSHRQEDIWWSAKELQARKATDIRTLQSKRSAQHYMMDCQNAHAYLRNELCSSDNRSTGSTESSESSASSSSNNNNNNVSSSITSSNSATSHRTPEEHLIESEIKNLITENIVKGIEKGHRGFESGGLSDRCPHTKEHVQAVVRHYRINKPKTGRFTQSSQKRALREQHYEQVAAFSQQLSRSDRCWARVLAMADLQIIQEEHIKKQEKEHEETSQKQEI